MNSYPDSNNPRTLLKELENPQPLRQTVLRMLHLLDTLEERHRLCVLHLDICPGSILLTGSGESELLQLAPCPGTAEGRCPCRNGYVAPEAVSSIQSSEFATDLYSVAAVFFHCIMGRKLTLPEALQSRPPDGRNSPILAQAPEPVQTMAKQILRKGLSPLPERRYRSIGAMRSAFRELLSRIESSHIDI